MNTNGRTQPPPDLRELAGAPAPAADHAEVAVLACLLQHPEQLADAMQVLRGAEDFRDSTRAAVMEAVLDLARDDGTANLVAVVERLKRRQLPEAAEAALSAAEADVPAAGVTRYARLVRRQAQRRAILDALAESYRDTLDADDPPEQIADRVESRVFAAAQHVDASEASAAPVLVDQELARIDRCREEGTHGVTGLPTGYFELDDMTGGLQASDLVLIAARPSMGKTALAVCLMRSIAVRRGRPVALFSLEMSKTQVMQRMLAIEAEVECSRIRRVTLDGEELHRVRAAGREVARAPFYVDDQASLTLLQLRAKARRLHQRHGLAAVFIDYLQLMSDPTQSRRNRENEVASISKGVKALARDLDLPVVCLSQLNRSPEGRPDHRPRMSDLRESGSLEQDADVVMFLHREDYYHASEPFWAQEHPDEAGVAEVIVAKQRNGPTGTVRLQFNRQLTRFANLGRSPDPQQGLL